MSKTYDQLYLFDYDGVVAVNPASFDIMKEALIQTAQGYGNDCRGINWTELFSETSGTTEARLAQVMCEKIGISDHSAFLRGFMDYRGGLIAQYGLHFPKSEQHLLNRENVFPDFEILQNRLIQNGYTRNGLVGLVTGNPGNVMRMRLPPRLRNFFKFQITGEMAGTRRELVEIAKSQAASMGWQETQDFYGRSTNAFYFDDTVRAVLEGMEANVRCVHPLRKYPVNTGIEDSVLYDNTLAKFGEEKAGRLFSGDKLSSPAVFIPRFEVGLSSSPFLLRDRNVWKGPMFAEGFLDPRAHQEWSRIMEGRFWNEIGIPAPGRMPAQSRK